MHRAIIRGVAVAGVVLLALSAGVSWFEVPAAIAITSGGDERCITAQPRSATAYRLACLMAAALLIRGYASGLRRRDRVAVAAALLLVSLFFFPYFVMAWDPTIAARASWLHIQHQNMVAREGDFSTNQEYAALSWRDRVYAVGAPQPANTLRHLVYRPMVFQLGQLPELIQALGYSNRFFQFVRPGWFLAIAGALGVLMSECVDGGRLRTRRVLTALRAGLLAGIASGTLAIIPLAVAIWALEQASEATARGNYATAERHLQHAAAFFPVIGEETAYVAQIGLLHWRLGQLESPPARLFRANLLEREGRYTQALEGYHDLLARAPRGTAIHREACRALLMAGIQAVNTGRTDRALALLETVLIHEPCNLKANFSLQLAYLRSSRRSDLERLVKRLEMIYACFQLPNKWVVIAFSQENLAYAAFQAGDLDDAVVHGYRAKHPEVTSRAYEVKHP